MEQAQRTRNPSRGLKALGNVKHKKSESGAHKVFKEFGQALPIKLSYTTLPTCKRYPYVRFSTWLKYLVENDQLDQLVGVKEGEHMETRLRQFWNMFEYEQPDHLVYTRRNNGLLDCARTIPVLHHGDEGRGYKKRQIMVLSTHGALGKGSRHDRHQESEGHLPLNMVGNTYLTHFLTGVMPVALYADNPEALDHVLSLVAKEFEELFYHGIKISGRMYWIVCIGVKGDQPYVTKSGHFERSFYRRPLRSSSRTPAAGICHLCLAGKEDWDRPVPYEQFGANCAWIDTIGIETAYEIPSPLMTIPFKGEAAGAERLWKFDLFHNWHAGIGKTFASSAIIAYLSLIPGDSVEKKFEALTDDFQSYCKRIKHTPYYKKLTMALFGIASMQDCPSGSWVKGEYTTLLMGWFEDSFSRYLAGRTEDPFLLKIVSRFEIAMGWFPFQAFYSLFFFGWHRLLCCIRG